MYVQYSYYLYNVVHINTFINDGQGIDIRKYETGTRGSVVRRLKSMCCWGHLTYVALSHPWFWGRSQCFPRCKGEVL